MDSAISVRTPSASISPSPTRVVHCAEALAWLVANPAQPDTSVVTSLPDVSEVELDFQAWLTWFVEAARVVIEWVPAGGCAIFFQSDILRRGVWVDKAYLVLRAAEAARAPLVWHKIVCRSPPGSGSRGRASYSHMLCIGRHEPPPAPSGLPDVLPGAGFMPSQKAMGVEACRVACAFLREQTATRTIVDPFCGQGTLLAVANDRGFDAIGIDRNARSCRAARKLRVSDV